MVADLTEIILDSSYTKTLSVHNQFCLNYTGIFMFKFIHTSTVSCFKRETWGKEPRNSSYDKTGSSCTVLDSKMTKEVTQVLMSSAKQRGKKFKHK